MTELAPTPRDTILRDGPARLYRFRRASGGGTSASRTPVLLIPSLINRWYVLDLRSGASLVESLTGAGHDVWCLDWGVPGDEDRDFGWDDVLARLARASRRVLRVSEAGSLALLGYCMGGTLAGIHAALHPEQVSALVNLAGPFDFSRAGLLREITDPRWLDAEVIAAAGNVSAAQMQSGFQLLRPTLPLAKWAGFVDRAADPAARAAFFALERWAGDNVPFPAAAWRTWVEEFYQGNLLLRGQHRVQGRRVDLGKIRCPLLTVVAERDTICPPPCATALNDSVSSKATKVLTVPGGHVGAVTGRTASSVLYPALGEWLNRAA